METSDKVGVALLVLIAAYTTFETVLLAKLTEIQPGQVVDEVCHIPQVQQYCKGNFSHWDQRITTLPGLYVLTVGVLKPLSILWREDLCTTFNLRFSNVLMSAANLALFFWIVDRLHSPGNKQGYTSWKGLLAAFNLAIFPPLHFFSYVYYTDVAAVFAVLLVYYFHTIGSNVMSAMLGVIATLVRQTNIVWVVFVAFRTIDLQLREHLCLTSSEKNHLHGTSQIKVYLRAAQRLVYQPGHKWVKVLGILLVSVLPYLVDGVLFAAFLIKNHGIVVGDRSAHQPTIHIPQLLYYCAFTTFFTGVYFLPLILPFLRALTRNKVRVLLLGSIISLIIHYNTMVHPYLLSDNRHYTFYVWMRFFHNNPLGRYFFLPVYMFGVYCICKILLKSETFLSTLAFWLCATIALVLQRLVEVRYFFIPFLLMKLQIRPSSWKLLIFDTVLALAINTVTIYLFVTKTIYWPDTDDVHRLMW